MRVVISELMGFESAMLRQNNIIRTLCRLVMGSDYIVLVEEIEDW